MRRMLLILLLAGLFPWRWWRELWWEALVRQTIVFYLEFPEEEPNVNSPE